jgi:hypothetical protein
LLSSDEKDHPAASPRPHRPHISRKLAHGSNESSSPELTESPLNSSHESHPRRNGAWYSPQGVEFGISSKLTHGTHGSSSPELTESPLLKSSPLLGSAASQAQGLTQLLDEFSEPHSPVSEPEEAPGLASSDWPRDDNGDATGVDVVGFDAPSWLQSDLDGGSAQACLEVEAAACISQREHETHDDNEVSQWLARLGLSKYAKAFAEAEIDMETLPFLGSADLFKLGVETLGPRRKIMHAIAAMPLLQQSVRVAASMGAAAVAAATAPVQQQQQPQQTAGGPIANISYASMPDHPWREEKRLSVAGDEVAAHKKPVFAIFTAEGAAAASAAPGPAAVGSKQKAAPKPLTLAAMTRRRGGSAGRGGTSRTSGGRRGGGPSFFRGRNRERLPCPGWRIVEGTKFVVDEFKAKPPPGCTGFFLSHFHADHYGGLTKSFSDGLIYCSQATANLVMSKLGVAKSRLCPLPLGILHHLPYHLRINACFPKTNSCRKSAHPTRSCMHC